MSPFSLAFTPNRVLGCPYGPPGTRWAASDGNTLGTKDKWPEEEDENSLVNRQRERAEGRMTGHSVEYLNRHVGHWFAVCSCGWKTSDLGSWSEARVVGVSHQILGTSGQAS